MSKVTQGKIIYLLSMLVMIFVVLGFLSIDQLQKAEHVRKTDEVIENIHRISLDLFRTDIDFYRYDIINNDFFKAGSSSRTIQHDTLVLKARQLIKLATDVEDFEVDDELYSIQKILTAYDSTFKILVEKIKRKGYKDYGYEGQLREYAHQLEDRNLLNTGEILMLRRHEKDYLLRHEDEYIEKFDKLQNKLAANYKNKPEATQLLSNYAASFHELIYLTEEIGMENQQGLKEKVNGQTAELVDRLSKLSDHAETITTSTYKKGLNFFIISVIIGSIASVFLIIRVAKKL
jgi:hypothetical protein